MSISADPVIGFDFTTSASSIFGEVLTLAATGGATRDEEGLHLTASDSRWDAVLPAALRLAFPITLMFRVTHAAAGLTNAFYLAARQSGGNCAFGMENRGSFPIRVRGLNGSTNQALNSSHTPTVPSTVTYFVEYTGGAFRSWANSSAILTSTATRADPVYDETEMLTVGRSTLGAIVSHGAIWNAVLTSDDRDVLIADPLAYLPDPPSYIPTATLMTLLHGAS